MKNAKKGDKNNLKAEWIKEGGEEIIQCLANLFNRVEEENEIPIQWSEQKLRQFTKQERKKESQKVKKGCF